MIAKHPERIRLIALDIWEHFKAFVSRAFKAQIVVVDREAILLYRAALSGVIAARLVKDGTGVVAVAIGAVYSGAAATQPAFAHMEA